MFPSSQDDALWRTWGFGVSERDCEGQSAGAPTDGHALCSGGGSGGEESTVCHVAHGDVGPAHVCCEGDLVRENQRGIEAWNGMESDPWDPTEPGCHIVHPGLVDLVSSVGTCCAGLCRQQCG